MRECRAWVISPYATFLNGPPTLSTLSHACHAQENSVLPKALIAPSTTTTPQPVHGWFVAFFGRSRCGSRPRPCEDEIFVSFFVLEYRSSKTCSCVSLSLSSLIYSIPTVIVRSRSGLEEAVRSRPRQVNTFSDERPVATSEGTAQGLC